ncbi:unnamed protein product, partial [Effrenium voratum]
MSHSDRLRVEEVDGSSRTLYRGRVCGFLPKGRGLLVDIDCEVPAFWYPELVSQSSSDSGDPQELPPLGSDVEVYCCAKRSWYLRVVLEQPPRLLVRGVAPLCLDELRPGLGPWRAVVTSATSDGTLVDFNCEVPGVLQSDQPHVRGEQLRVYCSRVDTARKMCVVSTVKEQPNVEVTRR